MFLQDLKLDNHKISIHHIYLGDQYMIGSKNVEFKNYQISGWTDENFMVNFTEPANDSGRKFLPKVSFSNIFALPFDKDTTEWLKSMCLSFSIVRKSDLKRFNVSVEYSDKELRDFLTSKTIISIDKELEVYDERTSTQDKNWLQSQPIRLLTFDGYYLYPIKGEWMFDKLEDLSFIFDDKTPQPVSAQFQHWLDTIGRLQLTAPCCIG
ncbi:MAG: hypothetical protein ACLVLR_01685 [Turicibacter sanguinis]